jgi:hypothetical protein
LTAESAPLEATLSQQKTKNTEREFVNISYLRGEANVNSQVQNKKFYMHIMWRQAPRPGHDQHAV